MLAAIVGIRARLAVPKIRFSGRRKVTAEVTPSEAAGSGIMVDPSGIVLTCSHLVGETGTVRVFLPDDREVEGTVSAIDRWSDLALVRIAGGPFPALDFAQAPELRQGEPVYLASRPGGASLRFLETNLAASGAYHLGHSHLEFLRRFLGAIEPGDSGAALVDSGGRLVGIVSIGLPEEKVGYAISRDFSLVALARLRAGPPVVWPWLGLAMEEPAEPPGATVWTVIPRSPAERAGLRPGDRIVSINGNRVDHFLPAMLMVVSRPIGSRFELVIERDVAPNVDREPQPKTTRLATALLSMPREAEPAIPALEFFEREAGVRLEEVPAAEGRPGYLRAVSVRPVNGSPPRSYGPGSRLIAVIPGLGVVQTYEAGRNDALVVTSTVSDLATALRASVLGDRIVAALIWETDGRRKTSFLSGEARKYPIL